MKHSFLKIISLMVSTLSLSSCVLFDVKYTPYDPEGKYSVDRDYSINEKEVNLAVGETVKLKAFIDGNEVPFDLNWKTSDSYVATVSSNGTVKAVGGGICTITVRFTKEETGVCLVNVDGPRKTPKKGALAKFFTKYGTTDPVYYSNKHLYDRYVIEGETEHNGYNCEYEFLYFDDHGAETPYCIKVKKYISEDLYYLHEYRFQENKFFDGFGSLIVYGTNVYDYAYLKGEYYAANNDRIALASGKKIEHGTNTPNKAATDEQMLECFYVVNDCLDILYDIMESKGSKIKLF